MPSVRIILVLLCVIFNCWIALILPAILKTTISPEFNAVCIDSDSNSYIDSKTNDPNVMSTLYYMLPVRYAINAKSVVA